MIELGKKQELTVIKKTDFGIYLGEEPGAAERVLLPKKQVPEGTAAGDKLTVFVYRDSKDRLICTTQEPKVQLGGLAVLKVVQVGKIGVSGLGSGEGSPSSVPSADAAGKGRRPGPGCAVY